MKTVTVTAFNQRPSQVKRAAELEAVVITEHGRPCFVLLSYAEYQRLLRRPRQPRRMAGDGGGNRVRD
jgi:prevent-host-death family protein